MRQNYCKGRTSGSVLAHRCKSRAGNVSNMNTVPGDIDLYKHTKFNTSESTERLIVVVFTAASSLIKWNILPFLSLIFLNQQLHF